MCPIVKKKFFFLIVVHLKTQHFGIGIYHSKHIYTSKEYGYNWKHRLRMGYGSFLKKNNTKTRCLCKNVGKKKLPRHLLKSMNIKMNDDDDEYNIYIRYIQIVYMVVVEHDPARKKTTRMGWTCKRPKGSFFLVTRFHYYILCE